jgi:hypothetical protein
MLSVINMVMSNGGLMFCQRNRSSDLNKSNLLFLY